jgi:neutral amino acid transport system permease protein
VTTRAMDRSVIRGVAALLMGLVLAPFVVLLMTSSADAAPTLCLPQRDVRSCVAGTIGTRAEPYAGVDVTLVAPDGSEETVTSAETGRWSFEVTEPGTYEVSIDTSQLPEGIELIPPAGAQAGSTPGSFKVDVPELGIAKAVLFQVRSEDFDASSSKTDQILQSVVNGLRLGLLIALASLGLSLIYGTTGLSNFAHAELVTLGGVLGYAFIRVGGLPLVLGGVVVVIACGFAGWIQDRLMWQPLRRRGLGLTQMMIVTIGLSLAMQYAFQYFVGAGTVKVELGTGGVATFGPVTLSYRSMISMAIAVVMIGLVGFGLLRTRIGRATRAVSDNPALAAASGIDVDKVIRLVWTLAAALAGLSGLLYALVISNGIRWDTGLQILLLLFAAVTLGGLGTAFGALVGSLIIGLVVELAGPLGAPGDLKYAVALGMLIVLLMVRPQGLLGRAERVG